MYMWQYGKELTHGRTDGWTSSVFLCSFVLLSEYLQHHACNELDPWSWLGMTGRQHCDIFFNVLQTFIYHI